MMNELGGTGSGQVRFPCGHENPASNRRCGRCGASRRRQCPLCKSPLQEDTTHCGACGVRLEDELAAVETSSEPVSGPGAGDDPLEREAPPWPKKGRWRRDDIPAEEDDRVAADRRRKPPLLAGAVAGTIAIVLGVGYFSAVRQTGFLGRPVGGSVADRGPAPVARSERPPDVGSDLPQGTSTPAAPAAPSAPAPGQTGTPPEEPESSGDLSLPARKAPPAVEHPPSEQQPSVTGRGSRPPTSSQARIDSPKARGDERPSGETSQAVASQGSVERMAVFLMEQLGPGQAAERALSNADWYGEERIEERAYWRRVAEVIRRREGR